MCRRVLDGSDPSFERDGVTAVGEVIADETALRDAKKVVLRCLNAVLITPAMVLAGEGNVS